MRRDVEEKERIGRATAEMIREGDRIIFDCGTTVFQVAHKVSAELLNQGALTITTASLPIVRELGSWKGVHLVLLGGVYLPQHDLVIGPQTLANLKGLHTDKVFIGTDGLTFCHGITTANVLEAELNRAIVEAPSEVIVVADPSKIGVIGLITIVPVTKINKLMTDTKAPSHFVAALREQGVEVTLSDVGRTQERKA